tara:strand:+ start:458 stop:3748 length:3291 start_codon:yes stop_codon:yes gene_type:complete
MATTTRQTSLLVQQDWTKIYQTFKDASFQSFDFETIRKSMIEYLRTYYPEDFNDFTESSEYVALIDLIAFLGQSLAFRTDLNARENFIDTAERRDSILKLAKLISYNPKRNIPASGFIKFQSVSTTESVFDSEGNNLANTVINWNDSTNENWLEQFTAILNASLLTTQSIGKPGATKTLNGIKTDEYTVNMLSNVIPVRSFNTDVSGVATRFEVVSASTADYNYVYEKNPQPTGMFNFLYRNDNQGNASNNTGYFFYFKQGELLNLDFSISESLPNRVVNVNFNNINNNDVWLYELDATGTIDTDWTKVPAVNGTNVIYNNTSERNLYSVSTRANDQIDLVFGDGSFTNIPDGNFRLYYRTSNNQTYKITPEEMSSITVNIQYRSKTGRSETASIRASLQYTVTNASSRESIDEIRTKAPQQYYTQNRMVSGEDYNVLPYTTFSTILKAKAVNRSSSGISRYLDVVDATGKYSSTNIFAQDGEIYKEDVTSVALTFQFTSRREVSNLVQTSMQSLISQSDVKHLYYRTATRQTPTATWTQVTSSSGRSTGTFSSSNYVFLTQGALIKFNAPAGKYFNAQNQLVTGTPTTEFQRTSIWASIINYPTPGIGNATLSIVVPSTAEVNQVIPVFENAWPTALITDIINNILSYKTFALRYDVSDMAWKIVNEANIGAGAFSLTSAGDTTGTNLDNSWFLKLSYDNQEYTVTNRGTKYFFESIRETRFYFDPNAKVYDSRTATTLVDEIKILRINTAPDSSASIFYPQSWRIDNRVIADDGTEDNRKILVTFPDENLDGVPDDPDLFTTFVAPTVNPQNKFIFFVQSQDTVNFLRYNPIPRTDIVSSYAIESDILNNISLYSANTVFYAYTDNKFFQSSGSALTLLTNYVARVGREQVSFQYKHNSPNNNRIDPSPNNLIDLFILTKSYSDDYTAYITDSTGTLTEPVAPTSEDLQTDYNTIENLKTVSDSLIYNAAKFKPLFGSVAELALRATFKVVKNPSSNVSDNEIKSMVIESINNYFDINNWDFGETFYFSELSAYLHSELTPTVSSIIIVPNSGSNSFGNLYQINAEPNEILVSAATVNDVQIISAITAGQLNRV